MHEDNSCMDVTARDAGRARRTHLARTSEIHVGSCGEAPPRGHRGSEASSFSTVKTRRKYRSGGEEHSKRGKTAGACANRNAIEWKIKVEIILECTLPGRTAHLRLAYGLADELLQHKMNLKKDGNSHFLHQYWLLKLVNH